MKKTIGILAHVDAGKTTFAEQLLYHTNSIGQRGRVDHQSAYLDNHDIEKARGITVYADQAVISYQDSTYYLVDTPGHVDFSPEMERTIQIMDYAIVMVSAVEGVEGHTETIWQLLRRHAVPTFFFINKTDRVGANVEKTIDQLRTDLSIDMINMTNHSILEKWNEQLTEFVAERDETLLDKYLTGNFDQMLGLHTLKKLINQSRCFPCWSGSALNDEGIMEFFQSFDQLTSTNYPEDEVFSGRVYKIRHDKNGNRITFIKALSGTLRVRDEINYLHGEHEVTEKVTQLRVYKGHQYETVTQVEAGQLFGVLGLSQLAVGDGIGLLNGKTFFELIPTLHTKINVDPSLNIKEVYACFQLLDAEDPSLQVIWDEKLQEIHIKVMGVIQLEVLEHIVEERFGYKISFGDPEILYKETIADSIKGYGHFEPLKHYAEVHLLMEPQSRGSGITFESKCHPHDLTVGNQNLIRHHLFERDHHGLLTGSSLMDVKVTLLTGRAHTKHTSGGDFREATFRALRQGLEQATNLLLEPYYDFKIRVDTDHMGRVLSDIQQAYGTFKEPDMQGNKVTITGKVPVATFLNYSTEFASVTQGKGALSLRFGGYDQCHNAQEVIARIGYDKDADPSYTSTSIFCAKGHGYKVTWDQAEKEMHISS
ncbi:GTP-binding protein [Aquibacillus kalidii]|uniref:GTP-binding protein n=1 Tax=Aquibacillus kalidii TaxID=2762597 RepID=UPI00164517CD|nr:TetM/TetW/TetO/TetS family tetracycline resistance ribosomal protection protein [Aquibacillus kalidii]